MFVFGTVDPANAWVKLSTAHGYALPRSRAVKARMILKGSERGVEFVNLVYANFR